MGNTAEPVQPVANIASGCKYPIRQNVYGNWYGYKGNRKVEVFFGSTTVTSSAPTD
jgi:hypothetical protein